MKFGPVPPRQLPQQDPAKVLLLAERWQRAAYAHSRWATPAKEAVDFFEGRQWTEAQLAQMKLAKRPAMTFNIIAPIVRLVMGYFGNNKADGVFKPGQDQLSTEEVAEALTKLEKQIAIASRMEFVDVEVSIDGLISGRGWYDTRLNWETNDLGEARTKGLDPFTVYPDPDADTYDVNESAVFMQTTKMVSIDEIEHNLGKGVADLVRPYVMGQTPLAPLSGAVTMDEITPTRFFGQREDGMSDWFDSFYGMMGDFADRQRKTIRVIETQHKVRELRNVAIDLETGDKRVLPTDWGHDKLEKIKLYAESVRNPIIIQQRMVERIQWTTLAGDVILYDAPSLYNGYTMTGYFPYFRRGVARGMVEDLIDPQKEKNKRRSGRIETEAKTANGGWLFHSTTFNPVQRRTLQKFGSAPGVNLEWEGSVPPVQIQPNQPSVGAQRLEEDADNDVRRISGVNESALGETDIANQSGVAIQARQRQATISVQMYMDNRKRSKILVVERHLDIIQNHYTEPRIYRITGEDGKLNPVAINHAMQDPATGAKRIINDVTLGKYEVDIDDAPISATFQESQWNDMMLLIEKLAPVLGPRIGAFADLIIGSSSMPRKNEWIERLQQVMGQGQQAPPNPPKQSINFKDLPPDGQVQMAQEAGIKLDPTTLAPPAPAPMPGGNVVPMPARTA